MDAFSHQLVPESDAITTVNFKGYTQNIPDPDKQLFNFLVTHLKPHHESD